MSAIGNVSLAINLSTKKENKQGKTKPKNKSSPIGDANKKMYNRNPHSYRSYKQDTGIDEFGYSQYLKLYGYGKAEKIKQNPGAKGPLESTVLSVAQKEPCIETPKKYKNNRKAKLLQEFMELNHERMEGSITDALIELALPGMYYGNNILEPTYQDLSWEDSAFPGMRIYKALTGKFPGLWDLKETPFNEPYAIESKLTRELFEIERFILFTWLRQYGRNKGSAIYDAIFKFLEAKDIIYQKSLIYINKFAGKIPIAKYENEDDADFALELAEAVYDGTTIAIPQGVVIEFLDVLGNGSAQEAFLVLFNWCDSQANMAIKGTSGLAVNNGTGSGTGSNASDEVKERKESIYEWYLQKKLEEIWYEQICKRIIEFNFDKKEFPEYLYPRMTFKEKKVRPLQVKRENIALAMQLGIYKQNELSIDDEVFIRDELELNPLPDKVINMRRSLEKENQEKDKKPVTKTKTKTKTQPEDNETDDKTDKEQSYSKTFLYYYPALAA